MRHIVRTTIAVNGHQSLVRHLDRVAKATTAAAMIGVADHNPVVVEVPILAIVVDDAAQAESVAIGRIAADGEGQQQPPVLELQESWIHFTVVSEVSMFTLPVPALAIVGRFPEHHPVSLIAAFFIELFGRAGNLPMRASAVDSDGMQ